MNTETDAEPVESFFVEETYPMERFDKYLSGRFPKVSRGTFQRMIVDGSIRVNGEAVKPTHHPKRGERVTVDWPVARADRAQPEEIPLTVLFEDEDVLVLNKPPGLVVHPAAGHEDHTLVNALLHHCAGRLSGIGGVMRPGIVHRLDKETSGCMVVAKNDAAHYSLSQQFAERTVSKVYHALVCGELPSSCGEIHAEIARHPNHRQRMAVVPSSGARRGRDAWTSYTVLQNMKVTALVEAVIHTGRTHQIRVHFQHLGCPLVGDPTYGHRQNVRLSELIGYTAPRVMLHAHRIEFDHPITGERASFEAEWPNDFRATLGALRRYQESHS